MSVCIDGARGNAVYRGHGSLHPGHRCATTTPPIQSLGSQQSSLSPPSTTTTTASSMAFLRTEAVGSGCDQESLAPGGSQHAAAGVARRADGMDAELRDRHQARPSRHSRVRDARAATKAHIPARQSVRVSMRACVFDALEHRHSLASERSLANVLEGTHPRTIVLDRFLKAIEKTAPSEIVNLRYQSSIQCRVHRRNSLTLKLMMAGTRRCMRSRGSC